MGLRTELQAAIGIAFDSDLSDAVQDITFKKVTGSVYNTATGDNVTTYSLLSSRAVIDRFTIQELHMLGIDPNDIRIFILQNELSTTPDIDDIVVYNSEEYKVIRVRQDPANVTWELQCRA